VQGMTAAARRLLLAVDWEKMGVEGFFTRNAPLAGGFPTVFPGFPQVDVENPVESVKY